MRAAGARSGLTLLEVLVALVILNLVVSGYLQLFHEGHELVIRSREWSAAVAYAVDDMERAKLEPTDLPREGTGALPAGYRRQVTTSPWQPGLALITVTVMLPTGGRFELYRLRKAGASRPEAARGVKPE